VSQPLSTGYTEGFYAMLRVMATHGNMAIRTLARRINNSLGTSTGEMDEGIYKHIKLQLCQVFACLF